MTVIGCFGDKPRADVAGVPGAAVDDDGLAEVLGEFLAEYAGDGIHRAAGGERHDDDDVAGRVVLRGGRLRDCCAERCNTNRMEFFHDKGLLSG